MSISPRQIIVSGLSVTYYCNEPPVAAATAVFLHGWQGSALSWQPILEVFDSRSVKFYALDLPGFGRSQLPQRPFSVGDYAEVVKSFMAKLEIQSAAIIGHSFGGRIAIKLASAYPELISKLVLVDCAGFKDTSLKKYSVLAIMKLFKPILFLPGLSGLRRFGYKIIGASDYTSSGKLKETFIKVINEDVTAYLPKIKTPTLLVWGQLDRETPLEFGNRMKDLIPASRLVVLPSTGHFSFLDDSPGFIKALEGFVL